MNANFLFRFSQVLGGTDIQESDNNAHLSAHNYYAHDKYKGGIRVISHNTN